MISLSDACDLNLDPDTVHIALTLSEGNKKVTNGSPKKYPDHSERFDTLTQVLCKEGLTGRHYWEVEWSKSSDESIYACVAYKGMERKGSGSPAGFGCNAISWAFGKTTYGSSPFRAYYDNGVVWEDKSPRDWSTVGVFLDWPAGTLSFYRVTNKLHHLYTFRTKFTEPIYSGFWASMNSNSAYLLPFK